MFKKSGEKLKQSHLDKYLKKSNKLSTSVVELSSEDDQTPQKFRESDKSRVFKENINEMSNPVGGRSLFKFKTPTSSTIQATREVLKTTETIKSSVESVKEPKEIKQPLTPLNDSKPEIKPLPIVSKIKTSSRQMVFVSDDDSNDEPVKPSKPSLFKFKSALKSLEASEVTFISESAPPKTIKTEKTESPTITSPNAVQYRNINEDVTSEILNLCQSPSVKIESCNVLSDYERLRKDKFMDSLNYEQLITEQFKFYKHFYEIHNQLPLTLYEDVQGYDKNLVVKIKSMIQSLGLRIKRKESKDQLSSLVSGIKLKNVRDVSPANDDQLELDEIMKDVEREKQICNGKFNNSSYVDLSSPSTSSSFKPRINMKNSTSVSSSSNNSHNNTPLDEDGFPMIDYSQLVDVLPSQPKNQSNFIDDIIPDENSPISDLDSSSIGRFHDNVQNDGITGEFDQNYEFSKDISEKFKYTFGLREFRQNQLQAINATMLNLDCFILMPTGGGKSLCYQLPAVCCEGVTIVVSPLKSLIYDQVNKLNTLDIKAAALSGELSSTDAKQIYSDINSARPTIKLLYITPEKISASTFVQDTFTSMYKKGTLARIVIDEAHCVSTWGHDFRPDYKRLGELKRRFPNVPMMALTATANPRVRADVIHQLQIPKCKWFLSSFNRPNLKYIVLPKKGSSTLNDIIALIKSKYFKASGIIYCLSRKDCETTAEKLQFANIKAICYHAGLADKVRERVQQDWITDKHKIVCATIAFGMGIDKPDVRFVIHYSLPKSIEGYYQEAGRAGRDGQISTCILYYNYSDKVRYLNMITKEPPACQQVSRNNLDLVVNFCENMVDCRRAVILNYFGEHFTRQQCLQNETTACDNCKRTEKYKNLNVTEISKKIVNGVRELCSLNRFTVLQLVDVFKGASTKKVMDFGHHKTSYHGALKDWEKSDIQRLFHKLIIENYLVEEIVVMKDIPQSYIKVGTKAGNLMQRGAQIQFSIMEKAKIVASKKKVEVPKISRINEEYQNQMDELRDKCYSDLMDVARTIAEERRTTVQNLIHMQAITEMSIKLPQNEEEMMQIPYVTKANFEKFGERFLNVIRDYEAQRMVLAMDLTEEEESQAVSDGNESEDDGVNWDQLGSQASTSNRRGYKRKSSGWGGKKILKKYKSSKARKTPKKAARGKNTSASSSKGWSSSGPRRNNLLPPPKPTF